MASLKTVYCAPGLRRKWVAGSLAGRWAREYPLLFDADDLRITKNGRQRLLHFYEWFLAIHLQKERAVLSLVEKYQYVRAHPRKAAIVAKLMSEKDSDRINAICTRYSVQAPDLLVYMPDYSDFWFAEAKGPGDEPSENQLASHVKLRRAFRVEVSLYRIREQLDPTTHSYPLPPSERK
jgi:hypothetical protein